MMKEKWRGVVTFIFILLACLGRGGVDVHAAQVVEQEAASNKIVDANGEHEITRYLVKDGKAVKYEGTYAVEDTYTSKVRGAGDESLLFHEKMIRSGTDVAAGQCGENLFWNLSQDGTITISGEGAMWDYRNDAEHFDYHLCPWKDYKNQIRYVVFEPGITYIGADAFSGCTSLKKMTFSDTIISIGVFAFMRT